MLGAACAGGGPADLPQVQGFGFRGCRNYLSAYKPPKCYNAYYRDPEAVPLNLRKPPWKEKPLGSIEGLFYLPGTWGANLFRWEALDGSKSLSIPTPKARSHQAFRACAMAVHKIRLLSMQERNSRNKTLLPSERRLAWPLAANLETLSCDSEC